jgi:hypothetical protein
LFLLNRPEPADLLIDGDELGTEVLKPMKLLNLPLGLAKGSWRGKTLGHGFASDLSGETELRPMAGVFRLCTMTSGLTAVSYNGRDRAGTQVA